MSILAEYPPRLGFVSPQVTINLAGEWKFRPCRYCGWHKAALTKPKEFRSGKGAHAGGMRCLNCLRHLSWLTQTEVALARLKP